MKIIPYGKQYLDRNDISEVKKSLTNNLITTGPYVKKFENKIRTNLKTKYAYTCSSGTAAIHLAFLSIGLSKNDIIILPSISFVSAANLAVRSGAKIFFSDINPDTGQTTPELVKDCIKKNKIKKIKAIVLMYHGGYPRNINEYYKLKKKYKCFLIEDSCHALGASYISGKKKIMIGSCKHSDISTFSLHPVKSITSGEGGIVTTNNKKIARQIELFRSHGIVRNNSMYWKYDVILNGFNYRLSDINSALGLSQFKKINIFLNKRKKIFDFYSKNLNNLNKNIKIVESEKNTHPSYHLVLLKINFKYFKKNKETFIKYLLSKGIKVQFHYIPFYGFKTFKKYMRLHNNKFKGSGEYYRNYVSLPIFYQLSLKDVSKVINLIKNYFDI